jgi:hypothetical protein
MLGTLGCTLAEWEALRVAQAWMSLAVWLTTNSHGQTLDVLMEDKSCSKHCHVSIRATELPDSLQPCTLDKHLLFVLPFITDGVLCGGNIPPHMKATKMLNAL